MYSSKKSLGRILQMYKTELRRHISRTTSVTNSDAMAPRLDQPSAKNPQTEEAGLPKKLLKLQKYHRHLSTLTPQELPMAARGLAVSKDQSREFMACFPDLVRGLTETGKHSEVPEASQWLAKLLQYTVPTGKKNRGLATVLAYKMLEKTENLTPENIYLANMMGWCVEMFHAQQLLQSDVVSGAELRRGAPAWPRRAGCLDAVNDAALLHAAMLATLRNYFSTKPYYKNVLETFNVMSLKCALGRHAEALTRAGGRPQLELFTMQRYKALAQYRSSYHTFQLPVCAALLLAGVDDPETHRQAKTVLLAMGEFFQIQDDFLDCFGEPAVTGKEGRDIERGRCTWLAVVALQRCSAAQRELLQRQYGRPERAAAAAVRALYEELALPHTYSVFEDATHELLRTQVQQLTRGLPHRLFHTILDNIFRRSV